MYTYEILIHMYTYIHNHSCIDTDMHTHMYIPCTPTQKHRHAQTGTHANTHMYRQTPMYTHTHRHAHTGTCMQRHTQTCTHRDMHAYKDTHAHRYIHVCTQVHVQPYIRWLCSQELLYWVQLGPLCTLCPCILRTRPEAQLEPLPPCLVMSAQCRGNEARSELLLHY